MTPLQYARERVGLSQRKLSELANVPQSTISLIEKEGKRSTPEVATKLVAHLQGYATELHLLYPDRYPVNNSGEAA